MKIKYKIFALLVLCCIVLSTVSCNVSFAPRGEPSEGSEGGDSASRGEVIFPEGEETRPEEWGGVASGKTDVIPVYLVEGESADLSDYLDTGATEGLIYETRCDEIASVSGSKVFGNATGRTEVVASLGGERVFTFSVTVEFMISSAGYNFETDLKDGEVHFVKSAYEANRILDAAIARRYHSVSIDFSGVSESFDVASDFDLEIELGSHAKLKILYYEATPYKAEFEIVYNPEAASVTTPLTEGNTYLQAESANMIARRAFAEAAGVARADNFNDFSIYNSNLEQLEVYNSEELWWAVEHEYLPVFPMKNTKAELFFERAKMILREIIYEGMTDTEKVIAIYEYLVDAVSYDYDAYERSTAVNAGGSEEAVAALKKDTCHYLEGVFEQGRAVCDGKTKAFILLCGIEGISALRATGSSLTGGVGHAWNYVDLDGSRYLVDTTEGDTRFASESDIAEFFETGVETVSYAAFLKPLDYHKSTYSYSELWQEVESDNDGASIDYFDINLMGTEYDFVINSAREVEAIFEKVTAFGIEDKFTFTFIPADTSNVFGYFGGVREEYDLDKIFSVSYGETRIYIALFDAQRA